MLCIAHISNIFHIPAGPSLMGNAFGKRKSCIFVPIPNLDPDFSDPDIYC